MGGEWTQACEKCCSNVDGDAEFYDSEGQDGKQNKLNL